MAGKENRGGVTMAGLVNVAVMHVVNAGKFWVCEPPALDMSEQRVKLQKLEERLTNLLCDSFEMPSNLPVNKLIAVKNAETGRWHRGELLSPRPTDSSYLVRVFLVDHGAFLVDVKAKDLQILPKEMHELPHQAFVTCLYGLNPLAINVHLEDVHDKMHYEESATWTPASETFVQDLLEDSTGALLKGIICQGHVVHGEIFLNIPGEGLVSINEELIRNNFAEYSEEKYQKVIERESVLESEMTKRKASLSNLDDIEEKCIRPKEDIINIKHVLMKDFLREYASKKLERQENTAHFVNTLRCNSEMNIHKENDAKRRLELKSSILSLPPEVYGRGISLKNLKDNTVSLPKGRGLCLTEEEKKPANSCSQDFHKKTNCSFLSLLNMISDKHVKNTENQQESQGGGDTTDNSVLSLGRIPAGYPLNLQESSISPKKMRGVIRKKIKENSGKNVNLSQDAKVIDRGMSLSHQNEGSKINKVTFNAVQDDKYAAYQLQEEKETNSDEVAIMQVENVRHVSNPESSILNTKFQKESSEKMLNFCLKSEFERKKTEILSARTSSKSTNQASDPDGAFHENKIMKMIRNHSKTSSETPSLGASNARSDKEQIGYSSKFELNGRKSANHTSISIEKQHNLMSMKSQPVQPYPEEKKITVQCLRPSDGNRESVGDANKSRKGKNMNPLLSLLDILKKKNKPSAKSDVEKKDDDNLQTLDSANETSKVKSGNSFDEKVAGRLLDLERSEASNYPSYSNLNSNKSSTLISESFHHREATVLSHRSDKWINEEKLGKYHDVLQKDAKRNSMLEMCPSSEAGDSVARVDKKVAKDDHLDTASTPEKLKAAYHIFTEALREMELRNSDKSLMDLTSLKKGLDDFNQKILEQSWNKPSLVKDEKPFSSECKNGQQKSASDSATTHESPIKEANDLFDEVVNSVHRKSCQQSLAMSTVVQKDTASIDFDVSKISSERIVGIQENVNTENSDMFLDIMEHQSSISAISECPLIPENTSTKYSDSITHSGIVNIRKANSEKMQDFSNKKLEIPPDELSSTADLCASSTESFQSMPKPVAPRTFELLRMFSRSKHLKDENNGIVVDFVKSVNESNEESDEVCQISANNTKSPSPVELEEESKSEASETREKGEIIADAKPVDENEMVCDKSDIHLSEEPDMVIELTGQKKGGQSSFSDLNVEGDIGFDGKSDLNSKEKYLSNIPMPENQSLLDDEFVSKRIGSFAKILSRIEAIEKNKTYNAIKEEGISIVNLSARLPLTVGQDIVKRKGSTLSLNSSCSSSKANSQSSTSVKTNSFEVLKQKTLEPEAVSPAPVIPSNLPSLLRNSWLSGPAMDDDCLFTNRRIKMCRVLVRGHFLAQQISSIAQATFSKSLHMALSRMGFRDPMRIQSYAWPALMRGHDIVMVNPPRSGKTIGYLVPLISFMLSPDLYAELPPGNGPLLLILCSSWKSVSQIYEFCQCLIAEINCSVKIIPTYAGTETDQILSLLNGCHVLISTPRCFIRLLRKDRFTTNIDRLCHLVFDEADTLLKLFLPEVKEILRECRLLLQRRARIASESNPSGGATSYAMVKLVAAAKSWCPEMEAFVTSIVEKPLLCIGSYLEAAVYARLKPVLHLVGFGVNKKESETEIAKLSEEKAMEVDDVVLRILKKRIGLYKIVVACESGVEVKRLCAKIRDLGDADVLAVHEDVHHIDRAEALDVWRHLHQSGALPVLLVSDEALPEVNIGDAECLIHVGIPANSKTQFGLRFSTMMDNYRNIFEKVPVEGKGERRNCFIDIVVDITKPEVEISGLIEFLQRLGMTIPPELEEAASKILLNKEMMKKKNVELCPSIKSFGECSDSICNFRHIVLADLDKPCEGIPTCGEVHMKILNVLDASHMSARLLKHIGHDGTKTLLPDEYYYIASDLARYFGNIRNRISHGNPEVGDLCGFESEHNLFHRARVDEVIYSKRGGKIPVAVSISLIDKGIKRKTKVYQLLYLPDHLKKYPAQVKEIIVCRMIPRDLDKSWSKASCIKVAEWLEEEAKGEIDGKVIIGKVVLALGNTLWVDPLECREWLKNHKTNVIHLSLRLDLLRAGLAIDNSSHIQNLEKLCRNAGLTFPSPSSKDALINKEIMTSYENINDPVNIQTKSEFENQVVLPGWEILNSEKFVEVNVVDIESPSCFRVQKVAASDKLKDLSGQIQSWISEVWQNSSSKNADKLREYCVDSFCLGFFKVDNCWNRARVISLIKSAPSTMIGSSTESEKSNELEKEELVQYQLYFVDYGDIVTVSSHEVAPIPENFINQLPFQAIECGLVGVKPLKDKSQFKNIIDSFEEWDTEVSDVFYELCREGSVLDIYHPLLAKVFGTDGIGLYGGTKYLVALYDKVGNNGPVHISNLLVERGLALPCPVIPEDEADDEMDDECQDIGSYWIGEGALIPFTPALRPSIMSDTSDSPLGSSTSCVNDSSCTALVPTEGSSCSTSEIRRSSIDDEEIDTYDIVMSDDEVILYEESLRTLLGIPPRSAISKADRELDEVSTTVEKTSSFGKLSPDGGDLSSFASFEDLGESLQMSLGRFEEIREENVKDVIDSKMAISCPNKLEEAKASSEEHLSEKQDDIAEVQYTIKINESTEENLEIKEMDLHNSYANSTQNEENHKDVFKRDDADICDANHDIATKNTYTKVDVEKLSSGSDSNFSLLEENFECLERKVPSAIEAKAVINPTSEVGDADWKVVEGFQFYKASNKENKICDNNLICDNIEIRKCVGKNAGEVTTEVSLVGEKIEVETLKSLTDDHGCPVECIDISSESLPTCVIEGEDVRVADCNDGLSLIVNEEIVRGTDEKNVNEIIETRGEFKKSIERNSTESLATCVIEREDVSVADCNDGLALIVDEEIVRGTDEKNVSEIIETRGEFKKSIESNSAESLATCVIEREDVSVADCNDGLSLIVDEEIVKGTNEKNISEIIETRGEFKKSIESNSAESLATCVIEREDVSVADCNDGLSLIVDEEIVKGTNEKNVNEIIETRGEFKKSTESNSAESLATCVIEREDVSVADCNDGLSLIVDEEIVRGTDEKNIGESIETGGEFKKSFESNNAEAVNCTSSELKAKDFSESGGGSAEESSETVEEKRNAVDKKDASILSDSDDVEETFSSASRDEDSYGLMPELVQAKTPIVKWAQSKIEITLKIDLPGMSRYNLLWESNNKLGIFASSDAVNKCCYMLEVELWASVNVDKSEHMAISDNTIKIIVPKALAFMEWPRLLLDPIRPQWLSVDFNLMEFYLEDAHEEAPTKVVNYSESDDEIFSDEDEELDDAVRTEEVNIDPYDPLS